MDAVVSPSPPRLAARPVVRLERRLAAPFAPIGRVETRPAALATAAVLALVSVAASLVAVFHLGDLLALSSAWRTATTATVIAWALLNDGVEPLGLRPRDLVGSLAGDVDTYRPIAAAWLSIVRTGAFVAAVGTTVAMTAVSVPLAATVALFGIALLASQAETVARRRAWTLGDGAADRPWPTRRLGRDEELVRVLTGDTPGERDRAER